MGHRRGVMKAALVTATIGGTLAVVEGLMLLVLGSLAGLAENPKGEAAMNDGYVVIALGAIVLTAVFAARRWPFVLAVASGGTAAVGFLVDNALWVFAAVFLLAAAALVVISKRGDLRLASEAPGPPSRPTLARLIPG
jgi:hypothetical protein